MIEFFFYAILSILVFEYLLDRVLNYLNSKYWSAEVPSMLKDIIDEDGYKKSMLYFKDKQRFSFVAGTASFLAMLAMIIFGGFAWVDQLVRLYTSNPILMTLFFFGFLGLVADILSTPFSVYGTFVIEEKYGFNKTTAKTFILDKFKGWLLGAMIGGGLLAMIVWIYESTGNWFWFITWMVVTAFMIFMNMFYSNLIVPLFNKQTPLEDGELRNAIEEFSTKVGFKLKNIYVIDGSKRSTKANAYFTGLGAKKRIVLYDTLIKDHETDELVAVLAHEIGHYKKKHSLKGIILSVLQNGLMLYILSIFLKNPAMAEALGAKENSFHMAILAFGILYSPLSMILGLLGHILSRKHEYQADRFAAENYSGNSLAKALKKLSVNTLSNLRPHPAYVFFHYSHPPLLERLKALDLLRK